MIYILYVGHQCGIKQTFFVIRSLDSLNMDKGQNNNTGQEAGHQSASCRWPI